MQGKIKQKGLYRVTLCFSEADFTAIVKEAEKAGCRRVSLPIKRDKPAGFAGEWLASTKGVCKFLKICYAYYVQHEGERLQAEAVAMQREAELSKQLEAARAEREKYKAKS